MPRGTPVRVVDETGKGLPTQSRPLATWREDLKYVKWLLVDFQLDLAPGGTRELFLEYGDDVEEVSPAHPVLIDQPEEWDPPGSLLKIDTGALRLAIRNTPPWFQAPEDCDFFAGCSVKTQAGWREVTRSGPGPFLYMSDQHGNRYDSCTDAPRPIVEVEEAGPMRACVCLKGWHATAQGAKFCPYILRIHLFAGKADMRIHHTFIFDQKPHAVELASIGMKLPLDVGKAARGAVAGCAGADGQPLDFLQASDMEFAVSSRGEQLLEGQRVAGWASLSGELGAAVAVVRNSWQEYPKGFAVSGDGIDIQIWPESFGETLKFTTPFEPLAVQFKGTRDEAEFKRLVDEKPGAPLNLKSLGIQTDNDLVWTERMVEKHARGRAVTLNDTGSTNGEGAAKTTEIYLRFSPEQVSLADCDNLARAVKEPAIAPADPAHTCATRALGHAYHAGDPKFEAADRGLDLLLQQVAVEPREIGRLYGMMRYGNMVCSHAPGVALAYLRYKDSEPEKALRWIGPYNNEACDQIDATWGNFARTGRLDHMLVASEFSRNVADVCFVHAHSVHPESVGLIHYHNCHQWSGGPSPSHSLVTGLLTDYYFTGNRRLLEVARECADWAVRYQEPCGILANRRGTLHREVTGPLCVLIDVYMATWEKRYGDLARRTLNWYLRTLPGPGKYHVSVYTGGDRGDEATVEPVWECIVASEAMYRIYDAALRLWDSKALREHILAEAARYVWESMTDSYVTREQARKFLTERSKVWPVDDKHYWTQWPQTLACEHGTTACSAYDLTGDLVYAAFAKNHLEGFFAGLVRQCEQYANWRFTWLKYGSYIPRMMRIVADALERDPEGLAEADRQWRRKRAEAGNPVYEGPEVDLTRDRMNANGEIVSRPPVDLPREAPVRVYEPRQSLGPLSVEDHE